MTKIMAGRGFSLRSEQNPDGLAGFDTIRGSFLAGCTRDSIRGSFLPLPLALIIGFYAVGCQKSGESTNLGSGGQPVRTGGGSPGKGGALADAPVTPGDMAGSGGALGSGGTSGPGDTGEGGEATGGVLAGGADALPATGGAGGVSRTGGAGGAGGTTRMGGTSGGSVGPDGGTRDGGARDGAPETGGAPVTAGWILSYFRPEQTADADSLYLAYSTDALHWKTLGSGKPAYRLSGFGTNHIRDPYLLRKAGGGFIYLATDWTLSNNDANYWSNPSSKIVVADSKDLTSFSNPRLLTLTSMKGPGGAAMHAWAPEAYYDATNRRYAIIWSGNDASNRNRIYISYTTDFYVLASPEPKVLFDPGYSVIDGTFIAWSGAGYLLFKDETSEGKDIQIARSLSDSLAPGFTRWDAHYLTRGTSQSTQKNTEGPFVVRDPAQPRWLLYADFYSQGGKFGCWTSPSLDANPNSWTRLAETAYSLPAGVRHANAVPVTQAELDAVLAFYSDK